ncbi:MAG: hypothetical protein AMXMBFR44_6990 [Candidatus Campbellbacteria bacterium]
MAAKNPLRVNVYLTKEEKKFIEERAKKNSMSVSEYVRFAALYEGITAGDPASVAVLGKRLSVHTIEAVQSWYERFKAGGKRLSEKGA